MLKRNKAFIKSFTYKTFTNSKHEYSTPTCHDYLLDTMAKGAHTVKKTINDARNYQFHFNVVAYASNLRLSFAKSILVHLKNFVNNILLLVLLFFVITKKVF